MKLGIPTEIHPGERRVAATPDTTRRVRKLGFDVLLQAGAGREAGFSDSVYAEAGATIVPDPTALYAASDIVLKVRPPEAMACGVHEATLLRERSVLIGFLWPAQNRDVLQRLSLRKITAIAMDAVPRITRAQKLDALSSMANVAGYRAVIEAAQHFPRFFTGQVTAAGKIPPAKVLVIGAGVAGLAAIGAARGLGAIVRAFDTRPEVREQVQSMGAEFLEVSVQEAGGGEGGYAKVMSEAFIAAEMALFAAQAQEVDIIVTTALIPGKPAPVLIDRNMVESMKPGSVVVDLAAEQGGNCALTQPGRLVVQNGVTIIGYTDLPSRMASQSSQLYGSNLVHMLDDMGGGNDFKVDPEDEVVRGALVLHEGEITWPPPPKPSVVATGTATATPSAAAPARPVVKPAKRSRAGVWASLAVLALVGMGVGAPTSFLSHFTVFVLACFVGWQVIWNVKPALHTPLMSVTNAISGIIIIGGILQVSGPPDSPTTILGAVATLLATINIAGGFLVTQRMLQMFRR